jgi:dinuclear metal center YbgI/SA1388 family protein
MGVALREVVRALDAFAPPGLAEPWDRPGLQVGDPSAPVDAVLVARDPSPSAVSQARLRRAQLLLTHHPLFLDPLTRIDLSSVTGRILAELVKEGIALFACHTNLDRLGGGVNDLLAQRLALEEVGPLMPGEGGLGRIGRLREPKGLGALAAEVGARLKAPGVRFVGDPSRPVERVAVIGGSGSGLWREAQTAGAHALVTGDVKFHTALECREAGFCLIDAGHASTESVAVDVLALAVEAWSKSSGILLRVEAFVEEEPFHWVAP